MKIKNKILKNYLNNEVFKENFTIQKNKLIEYYNEFNHKNKCLLNNDLNHYSYNIQLKENLDDKSLEKNEKPINIFNIRLSQTKDNLIKLSEKKWPDINICKNILEMKGNVKINIFI